MILVCQTRCDGIWDNKSLGGKFLIFHHASKSLSRYPYSFHLVSSFHILFFSSFYHIFRILLRLQLILQHELSIFCTWSLKTIADTTAVGYLLRHVVYDTIRATFVTYTYSLSTHSAL